MNIMIAFILLYLLEQCGSKTDITRKKLVPIFIKERV